MADTPKWEIQLIQLVSRALAQSAAVMDERGLALATVMPVATGGRGRANKLTCLWMKRGCGTRMVAEWSWTCLWTLSHWQNRHALVIRVTDLAICGQQNLMRHRVACTSWWWMECRDWKTVSCICAGTRGWQTTVETISHQGNSTHHLGGDVQAVGGEHACHVHGHDCCSWAIAENTLSAHQQRHLFRVSQGPSQLRWSIETLSVLSPIFRRKKCLDHSKTENGQSYRGVTGSWAQSIWTSTKRASSNNSGKLVMAGEKLWRVGSGECPAMAVCTRKNEDGDSAVSTNWPGRTNLEPNMCSTVPVSSTVRDLWVVSCCWGVADVVQVEEGCP
jgi:hypothetical protein